MTNFEYYDIRPCVKIGLFDTPFLGKENSEDEFTPYGAFEEAQEHLKHAEQGEVVYWMIFGYTAGHLHPIGRFTTFSNALDTVNAMLAPLAAARDAIVNLSVPFGDPVHQGVADDLDDIINQSSNEDRL